MLGDMTPFKIAGNLYFVGTYKASSHLIDTGDGLILIDVGYEETADVVEESLATLGFDVKDVKYIILSHGHYDHSDGAPKIAAKSGAKILLNKEDVKYLKNYEPDGYLSDGEVISLGNTEILCLHTPGHTEGTMSFFWNVVENGVIYRAGTFGGAGTNQLKKDYLDKRNLTYNLRGQFFESVERLRKEKVDIFIGNHSWQNRTKENYEIMKTSDSNPFINSNAWGEFLNKLENDLEKVISTEIKEKFVNYAHRGASEYLPENTMLSFYNGIYMGANGIETDVQKTKDGVLVLFHDDTVTRVTGKEGSIKDYTFSELQEFDVQMHGFSDKIVAFEDFLKHLGHFPLTFAIELKGDVAIETAEMLRKYNMASKTIVTSFNFEYIKKLKAYAPEFRIGWLTKDISDETVKRLKEIGGDEICPKAEMLTEKLVYNLHRQGFRVRAWGVFSQELMKKAVECGADGMTVNFPDKLTALLTN